MTYVVQTWADGDPTKPLSAARMNYIEAGILAASLAATGGGGGGGTFATCLAGSLFMIPKDPTTGFWPTAYGTDGTPTYTSGSASTGLRPSSRADIWFFWDGPDPSPPIVSSGAAGMRERDQRTGVS